MTRMPASQQPLRDVQPTEECVERSLRRPQSSDCAEPLLATLRPGSTTARLQQIGSAATYRRGDTVIRTGDPAEYIFSVVSGMLRAVRLTADGRRCITRFLMPGDFFGLTQRDKYSQIVEIVADATLNRYPRRDFEALLDTDARVGRLFFNVMCGELSAMQDRVVLISRKTALERMAEFLVAMADRHRDGMYGNGNETELPMNRSDVADYLGLTVETVSRLLKQLCRLRIIALPSIRRDCRSQARST